MAEYNQPIIVPWDFTDKAQYALEHALIYATTVQKPVVLLHIVEKEKEIESATAKLQKTIEEVKEKMGATIGGMVKVGSIFSTITDVIEETNAILAVMGTHGIKGIQKITGSWALKVIVGSKAPFIVVQAPPVQKEISDIVVPIDFRSENKEKLVWMNFINSILPAKFHLVYIDDPDKFAKKNILSNIKVAVEYLETKGIPYEIQKLGSKGNLEDKTIDYARIIDASMIIIMTTKNISTFDFILGPAEQKIIANDAKIPVMTINPREGKLQSFN